MAEVTVGYITDHPVAEKIEEAGVEILRRQSNFQRRKNSLFAFVQGLLQILNLLALVAVGYHWGFTVAIAVAIFLAETALHAWTKGPVTPSAVEVIKEEAARKEVVTVNDGETSFSVYHDI